MWGKPVREREFFLFLQFWKLHISKNKTNSMYLSLPSIFVLEICGRNQNTATSKSVHKQPYRTDCTDCTSRKSCPEFAAAVRRSIRYVRTIKCCLLPWKTCCCTACSEKLMLPYQIRTVQIYLSCWLPRNPCPSLPWKSCHFFAANPSSENGNFSFSCSLSISQSLLERMSSLLVFFPL
jgi:hypothetical protein